ncbi:MAG: GDP-mannose 4,6-dehydratase [Desulfurivibrionaceae bacterium]
MNKNKKALIIGISGQDGAYLTRLLLDKGYDVVGTSRDAQASSFASLVRLGVREQVRVESMSLNDFRSVIQVLSKVEPDEIYNLAGQSSVGLSFDLPVETFESIGIGCLNLLESLRFLKLPARLYNASSSECFGNTNGQPATESTPFHPRSPYATAKAAAFWQTANYREAYGLFACSGILFNHESPLRPERFVTRKIIKAVVEISAGRASRLSLGNIDIQRDWGWAPEFVEGMWLMLQQDEPDDYILATGQTFALREFVECAFALRGLDWQKYTVSDSGLLRPTDIQISRADPGKAEQRLGWQAKIAMPEVVRLMVEAELLLAASSGQ